MMDFLMIRQNWLWAMYGGFAFMIIVPAGMAWYYHTRIRRFTGGNRLRAAQRRLAPQHGNVASNLANASEIWRRVQAGEFGPEARRILGRCLVVTIIWMVVLAIWFGVLLYAEEQVKRQGGWPAAAALP